MAGMLLLLLLQWWASLTYCSWEPTHKKCLTAGATLSLNS